MKREQTKIYRKDADSPSTSGLWELFLFALFFVVVFSVIARTAHAASRTSPNKAVSAKVSPNSVLVAEADAPTTPSRTSTDSKPMHAEGDSTNVNTGALPPASSISTTATSNSDEDEDNSRWTTKLKMETSRTLLADEVPVYSGWYEAKTAYKDLNHDITGSVSVGWFQEFTHEKDDHTNGDIDNPILKLTKRWKNDRDFKSSIFDSVSVGLAAVIGASHLSAKRTHLGGIGPSVSVKKGIRSLHLGQAFGYVRGFYNYDIRDDGTVNAPDVLKSTTDISYDITDTISVSVSTLLSYAISFQNVGRTTEQSSISLDYSPTKTLGLSVGVQSERGTISEDGMSNHVALYDPEVGQGFLDLSLSF